MNYSLKKMSYTHSKLRIFLYLFNIPNIFYFVKTFFTHSFIIQRENNDATNLNENAAAADVNRVQFLKKLQLKI